MCDCIQVANKALAPAGVSLATSRRTKDGPLCALIHLRDARGRVDEELGVFLAKHCPLCGEAYSSENAAPTGKEHP